MEIQYRIVTNPNEETDAIELLVPEYKGLVYQYGKVQWEEETTTLNFEKFIRRLPDDAKEIVKDGELKNHRTLDDLNKDEELHNIMGDILVEFLKDEDKVKMGLE